MFDLSKLMEMQGKLADIKEKLNGIDVEAKSPDNKVTVIMNANKKIKAIDINDDLMQPENKEELEDMLIIALNKAVDNAENVANAEQASMANNMMPGIGNMFGS